MDDGDLIVFGCVVTFIALGGAYTILLEGLGASERAREPETKPVNGALVFEEEQGPERGA